MKMRWAKPFRPGHEKLLGLIGMRGYPGATGFAYWTMNHAEPCTFGAYSPFASDLHD